MRFVTIKISKLSSISTVYPGPSSSRSEPAVGYVGLEKASIVRGVHLATFRRAVANILQPLKVIMNNTKLLVRDILRVLERILALFDRQKHLSSFITPKQSDCNCTTGIDKIGS